ncbi:MAG TPA: ankyrin repeat domain-containing protein [Planctomycetota bacterium]|nr:ankyrin repeat domain-containing protein [Planctomycetota bacterium]
MTDEHHPSLFRPGVGERGMTALHWAACRGDPEGVREALAQGCEVNERDRYRGYAPVHWLAAMAATGGERMVVLHLLLQRGADINLRSGTNETALGLAREAGSQAGDELADALVRLGGVE